jgi:hypothetical protein
MKSSAVAVCGLHRQWQISAYCGGPQCCSQGPVPGTAFCLCVGSGTNGELTPSDPVLPINDGKEAAEGFVTAFSVASPSTSVAITRREAQDPGKAVPAGSCPKPGVYTCGGRSSDKKGWRTLVLICNAVRKWQLSADCGRSNCCSFGPTPGTAYCTCGASATGDDTA